MNRENEIINVRIDEIIPNRFQPRLTFNETELQSLAESIKQHGIIQPLVLRRIGDKFEIIAGERRYKASVMAGLTTVPAVIMNIDDQKSAEVAIVENLQRKNLTAIEEAQSYKKLLDKGYLTQDELATKMGVTQPTIANKLRLLNLTEAAQQALLKNQISERHARSLLAIANPNMQISMLNRIIGERLTVRQTDEEISKLLGRSPETINEAIESSGENSDAGTSQVITSNTTPMQPTSPVENNPVPTFDNFVQPTPNISSYINPASFDVDIDKIKSTSEDIIPEHKPSDIDMLMRTETPENNNIEEKPKKVSLEDIPTNIDMGSIVNSSNMAVNPFQNLETPETPFEIPTPTFERPYSDPTPVSRPTIAPGSSLIDEFRSQQPKYSEPTPSVEPANTKNISSAINVARNEARKIEELGFQVDTEEFDFEDMYQIIIKIKKD